MAVTESRAADGSLGKLATGSIPRLLWEYSLPAVVGMLVMSLYNVVDRIFIGQGVGPDGITGLTITFPVMNITTALGVLVGAGASSRVSILLGGKDHRGAQMVLGNSMTLMCILIAVYLTAFVLFLDEILTLFGADADSLPYARSYLLCLLPGIVLTNIAFTFNNVMRASGYPRKAMLTMIIGAVCNVALDPVFIFWLDMGITGAAVATDIAMAVSAVFVMWHFLQPRSTVRFTRGIYRLEWKTVASIVAIGASPSLINFAACAINAIVNVALGGHGGNMAIAAAGIFTTYTSLICVVVIGMCQGMQPVVGYNYGAGLHHRLKRAFWITTGAATALTVLGSACGMTLSPFIARAFTSDADLVAVTVHALRLSMLAFGVVGFQIVATNFFMAIGKAPQSIFLGLARQVIFLIPLLVIMPRELGLDGVWLSFPASDVLATVVTVVMVWLQLSAIVIKKEPGRHG